MDPQRIAKIGESQNEIFPVLNFLQTKEYLDPESSKLRVPGRENFFGDFHEEQEVYHVVEKWDQHELKCYMLLPKSLKVNENIPFHVLFHGGGLATGGGNYVHWFSDYKRDLAINANAITLIPMHRLMPEDRGPDIYQDVDNWWKFFASERCDEWVQNCLGKHGMQEGIAKLSKKTLLVSGESAGGLLAVYSWLHSPYADIRALYLQYPVLNYYKKDMPRGFVEYMGVKIPVDEVHRRLEEVSKVVNKQRAENRLASRSDSKPPIGMLGAMLLSNTQKWEGWFKDETLPPQEQAKDAPGLLKFHVENNMKPVSLPAVFIIHGTNDPAVPIANSQDFCEKLNDALHRWGHYGQAHLEVVEGEGHAFDYVVEGKKFQAQISNLMQSVTAAWCK